MIWCLTSQSFTFGLVNARPALEVAEEDVHRRGNLRHEVVDVGVPLAVVRGGEEQLRVVVQEDEAHVVKRADHVGAAEVAVQRVPAIREVVSLRLSQAEGCAVSSETLP